MARRSDHTRDELRELAIRNGLEVLDAHGFRKFSARAVADRIGYSIGTLYHVFGSLDNFILHMNAHTLDAWHKDLSSRLARGRGSKIHLLAKGYIDFCCKNLERWRALFEHHLPPGESVPDWYAPKMEQMFQLVEEALKPHLGNNTKRTRRAAQALWAGIHGICVLAVSGKLDVVGADSADTLSRELIDAFLLGHRRKR